MSPQFAMSAMCWMEFVLWAAVCFLFWRKGWHRKFPAMGAYLALHVVSTPVFLALLYAVKWRALDQARLTLYSLLYYAVYFASAVLVFLVCTEIFRSALGVFPGLSKLGMAVFRWVALISLVVGLLLGFRTPWLFDHGFSFLLVSRAVSFSLMRSASIVELCLLAFLCLSANALRLSVRDISFGSALSFGILAASDFVVKMASTYGKPLTAPVQLVSESMILLALGVWLTYCLLPEPKPQPVVVPASSRIYRWNEIASALGHTGTQVAIQQPANSFFLADVEKVVDKVLSKNLKGRESEL